MKIEKVIKIFILIILIMLLYNNTFGNYLFELNVNWGFQLPNPDKTIYNVRTEPGFLGDRVAYTILEYKSDRKLEKLDKIDWKSKKRSLEEEIASILSILEIDKNQLLNFDNEYLYYEQKKDYSSALYVIYMYNEGKIYIIEDIS